MTLQLRMCDLCGAPIETLRSYNLEAAGFGPRGTNSVVEMTRFQCAAGHVYDYLTDEVAYVDD